MLHQVGVSFDVAVNYLKLCLMEVLLRSDQNAGRIQSVSIDNSTFERVEDLKYLGTTLTNQNSFAEEIKSILRPGNACYY